MGSIAGVRVSSRNPFRPFLISAVAVAAYGAVSGRTKLGEDAGWLRGAGRRLAALGAEGVRLAEAQRHPAPLAALIAVGAVAVSLSFRESTAGGSDAFSYVTQADLWLSRTPRLRIEMPIAAAAPWPSALETFTPFGYRMTSDRQAVVPVTPPGLPLLMAAFARIAGHCAMSWVVPLTGGVLVWSTFLIGRRLGSDGVGLGGAWLVATSPTVLAMSRSIMSDVPAAAFWAVATAASLRPSVTAAFAAGLAASAGLMIRLNLLPLGAVLTGWMIWSALSARPRRWTRIAAFAAGLLPGCMAMAFINRWLYGSPAASGYGNLGSLFAAHNIAVNLRHYATWLSETQTPLALAGLAALLLPWPRIWPSRDARAAVRLLAVIVVTVFAIYAAYTPFQEWWYLRFLLPAWPAIFIGTAALILGLTRGTRTAGRGAAAIVLLALGILGIRSARELGVYPPGEGERRYATIAGLVAEVTPPSAVVVTTSHVGTLRYYGGRLTVRYDVLDPGWLDRALDWFERQGRRPYILLEEQELQEFRDRFRASSQIAWLEMTPVLVYEAHRIAGRVFLFDPRHAKAAAWQPPPIQDPQPRCPVPAATPPDYSVR
jgi:hypothetical protein